VGPPAISASGGGVMEIIEQGKNGFMYRYNEYQTLAHYIHRLFSDDALAQKIGQAGKLAVMEKYPQDKVGEALMAAYQKITQELSE
jgi:glycosyltransferase involved in cell wall biosynthesis